MTNQFKRPEEQRNQPSSPEETEPIVLTEDAAASPGKTQAAAQVEDLSAQLAEKEKELTEFRDKYLRMLAESENVRKRTRQQSEETVRIQRENLLRELLPIVDNLERAVDAARGGGNGKPIVEGVEMVLRSLLDFLRSQGVTPVEAVGQPFDPQHHEAVEHEPSEEHPPNTVVREFHRGYQIGDRTLRPARVSVAKQAASENSAEDKDE
ncbi:MAG: nucleotide exchange factor GrpE [Candidatus Binataceae bacterium]